jgi:hypothetical protein
MERRVFHDRFLPNCFEFIIQSHPLIWHHARKLSSTLQLIALSVAANSLNELFIASAASYTGTKLRSRKCGMGLSSWLRHYATSRKVAGSNSDEAIEVLN